MLLVLNLPLVGVWVKLLQIPAPLLYAGILVFATIGAYGITQSPVDLILLYLIGAIGFLMRRYDFPAAPVIIGMILGPLAEQNFRQAMTISAGDWRCSSRSRCRRRSSSWRRSRCSGPSSIRWRSSPSPSTCRATRDDDILMTVA